MERGSMAPMCAQRSTALGRAAGVALRRWGAVVALVLASGLPAAAGATPAAASAIEGPVWRLTRLRGLDEKALAALPDGATVRFVQGQVQGFGGCNRLAGSYTIDGDRLTVGPLAGTMMACPEPAMAVESAFSKALTGTLHFRIDDGNLMLTPESGSEPALVFAAAPPPRLEGVAWQVTGYNNGRHAVVSPLVGSTLTLTFDGGVIVGNAGCNSFRAAYTQDGDRLTVGPPAATRKMCKADVMEQEQQFLAAIQSATTWAIDGRMLDLHRADGERVLNAQPAGKS